MKLLPLVSALVALGTTNVHAGNATLTHDRAAFEAALVGPFTVETFGDGYSFPISTGVLNSTTELVPAYGEPIHAGDIQAGATYSTPVGDSYFLNIDTGGGFSGGFLDGFYGTYAGRQLTVKFDQPVNSFGFDTNYLGGSQQVTLSFTDHTTQTFMTSTTEMRFFGFSGSAIDSVTIGNTKDTRGFAFALDNVTFGQTTAVPEPESLALTLGGLLMTATLLRRRRQG